MAVRKLAFSVVTVLSALAYLSTAHAADPVRGPFESPSDALHFQPIFDADLDALKPAQRSSVGWYGTIEKLRMWVTRPDGTEFDSPQGQRGDWTMGTRIEAGYMSPTGSGWGLTHWDLDGPNEQTVYRQNPAGPAEPDPFGATIIGIIGQDQIVVPFTTVTPDPGPPDRFAFRIVNSTQNVSKTDNWELNKTYRLEPHHYGGLLEPLFGFRYVRFQDFNQSDFYNIFVFPPRIPVGEDPEDVVNDQVSSFQIHNDNRVFSGQIGFRYFKYYDRWTLSSEFRAFGGVNWQSEESELRVVDRIYVEDAPFDYVVDLNEFRGKSTQTVYGFDVRAEAAYQLTRDVTLRFGLQYFGMPRGIRRTDVASVNSVVVSDQDVHMVGASVGVTVNR